MKHLLERIQNPDVELQERLFQLLSTIALAEFVIVAIYTVVIGGSFGHIALMLVGTALFAVTVTLTFKTRRLRLGATIAGLLYFMLYPMTFFSSGGMYGGAPVVFAFALVYVFLITQKWERVVCMILCVAASAACFAIAYLHPELLTRHSVLEEHIESFLAISLVTLLLCALFTFVTGVYNTERSIVERQKKEIEALNLAQNRFFSSMSHEIRTPVNAIIGLNEMTLREDVPDEVRENSLSIEVASKQLLHSVNEILDMSRLETGSMKQNCANYVPTDMLSDVAGMVRLQAEEKRLDFSIEVDPRIPRVLFGDEMRIKQVLLNVVNNALKYTRQGSVALFVSGYTLPDSSQEPPPSDQARMEPGQTAPRGMFQVVYDVKDTGIGIKQENIEHLFTAFQRIDEQENRTIEGTGLGLNIVAGLLDMMQGSITVESEYGKGSVFHIEIPQAIVDSTPIGEFDVNNPPTKADVQHEAFKAPGMAVLAVDDTPMNLKVVTKLLRDTEIAVDTAESGEAALAKTLTRHYDVILMDHQMPGMDGIECLHRIRVQADGKCRDSKVVCLTANAGADVASMYKDEGFDGYLPKPLKGKALEDELARLSR